VTKVSAHTKANKIHNRRDCNFCHKIRVLMISATATIAASAAFTNSENHNIKILEGVCNCDYSSISRIYLQHPAISRNGSKPQHKVLHDV